MILVTGGAGYIGSHFVLQLLKKQEDVIVFDSLELGNLDIIDKLQKIKPFQFVKGNLKQYSDIDEVFKNYKIDAVAHFAAYSQVGESIINPLKYYENNVGGSVNLFKAMIKYSVNKLIFSSTAAVYGEPNYIPIDEKHPTNPINPYGKSKLTVENILDDLDKSDSLKSVRLRYFNVAGAIDGIGEKHNPETHLIPNILKSTFFDGKIFEIYGEDYDTKDGTCVRDYIDIEDLVSAHILALEYLNNNGETALFNLGTSQGNTVKEVFEVCKEITKKDIQVNIKERRKGDPAVLIADNRKAMNTLGWKPIKTLTDSVVSAYKWEKSEN